MIKEFIPIQFLEYAAWTPGLRVYSFLAPIFQDEFPEPDPIAQALQLLAA